MISKSYSKTGKKCRVTFKIAEVEAENAVLLGDFNEWNPESNPLKQRKDGSFSTSVSLEAGQSYRFRYLLDGENWINDTEADELALNRFGSKDCVLAI